MLRIDEISVGRATGRMSPTSHGSPPTSKKKPSKKANFSDLRRKSKEHQNSVTPHISKMLANQLNPIAFMHRENQSKNTSSTGGATLSPGDTESPFTGYKISRLLSRFYKYHLILGTAPSLAHNTLVLEH